MAERENGAMLSAWNAPECPFAIEYSPRALDEIRLAVVDAFFSLPHGGAEIGGVLFGRWDGERLAITDYGALDCEHAFGPSFTLSPRDEARLAKLLALRRANGLRPVGWYHSHTRSEICLSGADQEIHQRFFLEPWQVALVLKPHTFHPTRAGFFFRGADGGIHAETSYHEFVLTPLAAKLPPESEFAPPPAPPSGIAAEPEKPAPSPPLPKFLDEPQPGARRRPKVALALLVFAVLAVLGTAAYLRRDLWLPQLLAMAQHPSAPVPPPMLGLNTINTDGQLQIHWNRDSAAVQQASSGVLSIEDGDPVPQQVPLDKAHLLSGAFTYTRRTERVDVSLTIARADGRTVREAIMFIGKPPLNPTEGPATQTQSDDLAKQVAQIRIDLKAEIDRSAKLKMAVDQLTKQVIEQKRVRLLNQVPDRK